MTQYCDYSSTFQFTQALPGANEPIERVFFSMNNRKWNDAKAQVKTETFEVEVLITTKTSALPAWTFMNSSNPIQQLLVE